MPRWVRVLVPLVVLGVSWFLLFPDASAEEERRRRRSSRRHRDAGAESAAPSGDSAADSDDTGEKSRSSRTSKAAGKVAPPPPAAPAQVYVYKDAEGRTVFTNLDQAGQAEAAPLSLPPKTFDVAKLSKEE